MIAVNEQAQVVITLRDNDEVHPYNLQAMVRVLGLALSHDMDDTDRDCCKTYCRLLEEMLPSEGQLVIAAATKPSPSEKAFVGVGTSK